VVAFITSFSQVSVNAASVMIQKPADVVEGDLLFLFLVVGNKAAEAATLSAPVGWRQHLAASPITGSGPAFQMRQFQAFAYADDSEPSSYTFTYSAVKPLVAVLLSIRGAKRDFAYDMVNYPFGFFAPGVPTLGTTSQAASTSITPFPLITTSVPLTLGLYVTIQFDAAGGPILLDDPSPLIDIIYRAAFVVVGKTTALIVMGTHYPDAGTAPAITMGSSAAHPWLAAAASIESVDVDTSPDNYKSKLLRGMWPPPYNRRLSSNLGKLLTIIGTSDNDLGGLFGDEDFLPDEEL